MLRNLFVPLDGSPFGEQALSYALTLARRASAPVHLVHVHEPLVFVEPRLPLRDRIEENLLEDEQAYLDKVVARVKAAGVSATSALLKGRVAEALGEEVERAGCDFIVMTTHGRGPLSRFWLGSVVNELIRRASVPLLLVRAGEGAASLTQEWQLRHILVSLDGSVLAEQVLEPAVTVGRLMMSADFKLLQAIPPLMLGGYEATGYVIGGVADMELLEHLKKEAAHYLAEVADRLRKQGLSVTTELAVQQHPAEAILSAAGSDALIAIATHGRGGLGRLLLGSVADKVVRAATGPVLVYRPRQSEGGEAS
jgi:nucleotide-binding universal stress UspA family protein